MFISILILILFLPVTLLPLALDTFFSSNELSEMGIYLGNSETAYSLPISVSLPKSCSNENTCRLWKITEPA
jgi:hypothetical protein